jgi:hypothetical protein
MRQNGGIPPERTIEFVALGPQDWAEYKELRLRALRTGPQAFGSSPSGMEQSEPTSAICLECHVSCLTSSNEHDYLPPDWIIECAVLPSPCAKARG